MPSENNTDMVIKSHTGTHLRLPNFFDLHCGHLLQSSAKATESHPGERRVLI